MSTLNPTDLQEVADLNPARDPLAGSGSGSEGGKGRP